MNTKLLICIIVTYLSFIDVSYGIFRLDEDSDKNLFDKELHEDVLDSELCQRQLSHITRNNLLLLTRFLDAGIRIPRGILVGNTVDYGNFRQCLAIKEEVENMTISGKYCSIRVPVNQDLHLPDFSERFNWKFDPSLLHLDEETIDSLTTIEIRKASLKVDGQRHERVGPNNSLPDLQFRLAICIPRPCTTDQAINGLLFNLSNIGFEYTDDVCRLPDDKPWAPADYTFIAVFSILGIVTVISTAYDLWNMYLKKDPKQTSTMYRSFSVYTNTQRILKFSSGPGSLECLDGIRAISMSWVILGHSFSVITDVANPIESLQWSLSLNALWVTVGPLAVDTFFLMSGILLVYTTADKFHGIDLLKNLHLFYLHRFVRIIPLLAAVVLFEASVFFRASDGPLWSTVSDHVFNCRQYWWSTLLHVQNFVNPQEQCIPVAWYLAIDMHLHILSPLILFWVLGSKRVAWISLNIGLIATLMASSVFIFFKQLPSGVISPTRQEEMNDFFVYYYMNTLTRAAPFVVGMVYGYLIHLWRKKRIEVLGALTTILLVCSLLMVLLAIYCTHISYQLDWDNQLADNIFNSFLRAFWALGVGWLIFACVQGKAGLINWFLCLPIWKLPARLSYAMYLIHYTILVGYYASVITPVYFTVSSIIFNFMAFMSSTLVASFFATLLIDYPFSTILKQLLSTGSKSSKATSLSRADDVGNSKHGIANTGFKGNEDNNRLEPLSETVNKVDMKVSIDLESGGTILMEQESKNKHT